MFRSEYLGQAYQQEYMDSSGYWNYQGANMKPYEQFLYDSKNSHVPTVEVLPSYFPQYEYFLQPHKLQPIGQYPQYYPVVHSQYPEYPKEPNSIPEIGSSYISSPAWPNKYYIDDHGKISPPLNPMGNIAQDENQTDEKKIKLMVNGENGNIEMSEEKANKLLPIQTTSTATSEDQWKDEPETF